MGGVKLYSLTHPVNGWKNFTFTRHKFLLVTVNEWIKSVLNYRSYHKNKTGYPFLDHPVEAYTRR